MKNIRSFNIKGNTTQNEDSSFNISFSSETPYLRLMNGKAMYEVLSHDPNHIDFSRANQGLSLLWNHDKSLQVGRAENINLDPVEKKCIASIRFGAGQKARELEADVASGICQEVSFGYEVRNYEVIPPKQNEQYPTAFVTDWMPYEVSLVAIPADSAVGVGRGLEETPTEAPLEDAIETPEEDAEKDSTENETNITVNITVINDNSEELASDEELIPNETTCNNKTHLIIEEKTMENLGNENAPVTMPKAQEKNFEAKEMRGYSIGKAINGILNGTLTGLEREVSQELNRKGYQSTIIPAEAFVRTGPEFTFAGSHTGSDMNVPQFGSYLDLLLTGSALSKLGVPVMNLQAPTVFPALDTMPEPNAHAEGAPAEFPGAITTRQVLLSPQILVSGFGVSRTALMSSPASLDSYLKSAIMKKHVQAFDKKAIAKILTQITQTVTGVATSVADIMALATKVQDLTDMNDTCAFLTRNALLNALKITLRDATLNTPVATGNTILDWKAVSSSNIAEISAGVNPLIYGDWSYAAFASFGPGVNIVTDIYGSNAFTDSVSLIAQAHYDAAVMNTAAFAKIVAA